MTVRGSEGLTIRSILRDRYVPLRSVDCTVHGSCIASHLGDFKREMFFNDSKGVRRLNDPFDQYGSL